MTPFRSLRKTCVVSICLLAPVAAQAAQEMPDVLIITVDTLRADRLSIYGYERPTTPSIDALIAEGVQFTDARTVEPLTGPALSSMVTSLFPHEHGSTRNGVRIREGLPSFTKILERRGYATAAFVGNWTLNDDVSGLAEHFETYETVLTRKRWFLWSAEAGAEDISAAALSWLAEQKGRSPNQRVALWVHYVEPHSPYVFHDEYAARLGFAGEHVTKRKRYDTEVAYVDERIGRFLDRADALLGDHARLTVFAADHGESLGEHTYWGHGRHCYETDLRIPLAFTWPGHLDPGTAVSAPSLILDIPQTILGLVGLPTLKSFQGYDWSDVMLNGGPGPADRPTFFQTHKGSVKATNSEEVRQRGLLEVCRIDDGRKEIVRLASGKREVFDLNRDPNEESNRALPKSEISPELAAWLDTVQTGLALSDELPPPVLSSEEIERMRALGYLE